ncbi:MAG: 1-deoxy-D-xylulose-5-phosphate reductoisomerase, partial [Eubacteriales bacterium]|nr:1-deoxy-D-xylulose-5-phosphate reductoisomerase [Eubacteriales bacterium]
PDFEKYRSLRLAYEAEDKGEIAVIAMSAADEVAVKLFLDQKISFTDIPKLVSVAVESAETGNAADFNDVLSIDRYTREYILKKAGF